VITSTSSENCITQQQMLIKEASMMTDVISNVQRMIRVDDASNTKRTVEIIEDESQKTIKMYAKARNRFHLYTLCN